MEYIDYDKNLSHFEIRFNCYLQRLNCKRHGKTRSLSKDRRSSKNPTINQDDFPSKVKYFHNLHIIHKLIFFVFGCKL